MGNYFYDMIPAEELAQLSYLPTLADFLEKLKNDYADRKAVSDLKQHTHTLNFMNV